MYGSTRVEIVRMSSTVTTKVLTSLQAMSSNQAQRKHLRNLNDRVAGTWKAENVEVVAG